MPVDDSDEALTGPGRTRRAQQRKAQRQDAAASRAVRQNTGCRSTSMSTVQASASSRRSSYTVESGVRAATNRVFATLWTQGRCFEQQLVRHGHHTCSREHNKIEDTKLAFQRHARPSLVGLALLQRGLLRTRVLLARETVAQPLKRSLLQASRGAR